jgi:hypothetical protein
MADPVCECGHRRNEHRMTYPTDGLHIMEQPRNCEQCDCEQYEAVAGSATPDDD